MKAGSVIGLLNGKLVATGDDMDDVVRRMLDHAQARDREIVTIYYGENVDADEARRHREPWCGSIARSRRWNWWTAASSTTATLSRASREDQVPHG